MSENKITFPVKLASNNPQSFGIVDAIEVSGHKSVDTLSDLYAISDPVLSVLKDGSDAIGQEWFVVSEDCKYRLDNWENRKSLSGWIKLPKQELINTKQSVSEKDQPNGYAGLDSNGKLPIEKTYGATATVVDIATYESLPVTGSSGVIYYVSNTGIQYKWSGSSYVDITDGADNAKKNETSVFDCSNGTSTKYYSSLSAAINVVPPVYRTSNRIISYLSTENSPTSAVNYQYHGIDSTTWTDLTKWERIPNQADLADIRSDLNADIAEVGYIVGAESPASVYTQNSQYYVIPLSVGKTYYIKIKGTKVFTSDIQAYSAIGDSNIIETISQSAVISNYSELLIKYTPSADVYCLRIPSNSPFIESNNIQYINVSEIELVKEKLTEDINGVHEESVKTIDDAASGLIYNGTKVTANNATFNSFIINIEGKYVKWVGDAVTFVTIYSSIPTVDSVPIKVVSLSANYINPNTDYKYAMFTVKIGVFNSLTLNIDKYGVREDVADLNEAITALEQEQIQGGVYDVSSHNDGVVFESLSTLLGSANLSTLIPTSVRRGGMSIRFIQGSVLNSDEYVQFRYMGTEVTGTPNPFLGTANWQGVVSEPNPSNDCITSEGVYNALHIFDYTDGTMLSQNYNYALLPYNLKNQTEYILKINASAPFVSDIQLSGRASSATVIETLASSYNFKQGDNYISITPNNTARYLRFAGNGSVIDNNKINNISVSIVVDKIEENRKGIHQLTDVIGDYGSLHLTEEDLLPLSIDLQTKTVIEGIYTIKGWIIPAIYGIKWNSNQKIFAVCHTNVLPEIGVSYDGINYNTGYYNVSNGGYFLILVNTNNASEFELDYIKNNLSKEVLENTTQINNIKQQLNSKDRSKKIGSNTAIISFLYDGDGVITNGVNRDKDVLYPLLKERGLFATFAVHGGSTMLPWYKEIQKDGFGTMVYGCYVGDPYNVENGVNVSNYIDLINNAIISKDWFIANGLQCDGFVQYMNGGGATRDRHFESLFYKYTLNYFITDDYKFGINNLYEKDVRDLGRLTTDRSSGYETIYQAIDYAVAHGEWLSLGGHMSNTGMGTSPMSTLAEFTELLDYIENLVNQGLLVCVDTDTAFAECSRRMNNANKPFYRKRPVFSAGDIEIGESTIKLHTSNTTCAKYKVETSGSFPAGTIVTITEDMGMDGNTLEHTYTLLNEDTIGDVISNKIILRNYACEIIDNELFFVRYVQTNSDSSTFNVTSTNGTILVTKVNEQVSSTYKQINLVS